MKQYIYIFELGKEHTTVSETDKLKKDNLITDVLNDIYSGDIFKIKKKKKVEFDKNKIISEEDF